MSFFIAHSPRQADRNAPVWVATNAATVVAAQRAATRARPHYCDFAWVGVKDAAGNIVARYERDRLRWTSI